MNIAGVLVHSSPGQAEAVQGQLLSLPGVEVHATTDDGRLVVTVEEDDDRTSSETVMKMQNLDGVLSAAMIYHHCECDPSEQEASK